jgi:hypothetical protein
MYLILLHKKQPMSQQNIQGQSPTQNHKTTLSKGVIKHHIPIITSAPKLSMQIMPLTQDTPSLRLSSITGSKSKHAIMTQECMWAARNNMQLLPTLSASTIKFGGAILDAKKEKN